MRNLLKGIVICVVFLMVLNIASSGYAQDMGKKLCRGLANIFTGWMEIPKNIQATAKEENFLSGITLGLAKGGAMTFVRTGFGIYETVTFPIPLPDGYNPLLEPEFIFNSK